MLFCFLIAFSFVISASTLKSNKIESHFQYLYDHPPVVYITFGEIPLYLRVNIELASRNSPVLLITDTDSNSLIAVDTLTSNSRLIIHENLLNYNENASKFKLIYKSLIMSERYLYELRCFLRWFILHDFMLENQLTKVLFADGDSSIFVSTTSIFNNNANCDAIINIESQSNLYHFVGAGEASLWSLPAIIDFCQFLMNTYMYDKYMKLLYDKKSHGTSVCDMSLLWLYWVAHTSNNNNNNNKYENGKPFSITNNENFDEKKLLKIHQTFDESFLMCKKSDLPKINNNIRLCNGMDIVNRTTFDHMHGWSRGNQFRYMYLTLLFQLFQIFQFISFDSFDFNKNGVPYVIGISQFFGGKPEIIEFNKVTKQKYYFNNLHYQGGEKDLILYDICRVLLLTQNRQIIDKQVNNTCYSELSKRPGLPCQRRSKPLDGSESYVCA